MTVHRDKLLVNKTNRRTEFQIYWYYDSTRFGQPFCPSSGVLSCRLAFVHFMQIWWPFATRSRTEHPAAGSKRSSNLHKMYQYRCTAKNSWWWAERLPETCRVIIPIKLEFSASVGLIHKELLSLLYCYEWNWNWNQTNLRSQYIVFDISKLPTENPLFLTCQNCNLEMWRRAAGWKSWSTRYCVYGRQSNSVWFCGWLMILFKPQTSGCK